MFSFPRDLYARGERGEEAGGAWRVSARGPGLDAVGTESGLPRAVPGADNRKRPTPFRTLAGHRGPGPGTCFCTVWDFQSNKQAWGFVPMVLCLL